MHSDGSFNVYMGKRGGVLGTGKISTNMTFTVLNFVSLLLAINHRYNKGFENGKRSRYGN